MNPFGPILRFELVRAARRQRLVLSRVLYAAALAGVAAATYVTATKAGTKMPRPRELALITEGLFYALFAVQFAFAVRGVVGATADAFTAEKERRTLPFLLATPLGDTEIVLGKYLARLARVCVFLFAGLPVFAALQFFGGIDPHLVVIGYAALLATMLSLGALSLLCSIYARNARAAAQRTGRVVGLYVVGLYLVGQVFGVYPAAATWPGTAVTVGDAVDLLDVGNPLSLGRRLSAAIRGGSFDDAVEAAAWHYVEFHLLAAGVFVTWAVRRLRPVSADLAEGPPPPRTTGIFRPPPRPPVGKRPVLWKALHFDFRQYHTAAGRAFAQTVFVLSFTPLAVTFGIFAYLGNWRELPHTLNYAFVRGLGTAILAGVLIMIAAQASACIALERRKQTLDELLLTDLSTEEILSQKWWASILVVRPALVWVGIHWLVAIAAGGLHPLAVAVLVIAWCAYAAFAASLGLYWAARLPTARAAGVPTGLIGFAAIAGPVVLGVLTLMATQGRGGLFALPFGLTPPFTLWMSAFTAEEVIDWGNGLIPIGPGVVGAAAGVVAATVLSRLFWRGACERFPRTVGR